MKSTFLPLILILLSGCFITYPTTTFWINNNTDETVNFNASVIKRSSMGPFEMSLPFTVEPGDSVLFRQVGFRKNANPVNVFKEINFLKSDTHYNNPKDSSNWHKTYDKQGRPQYTFFIYPVNP